ncbi:MAG: hypothetical protein JSW14_04200 [Candidatus Bathyarchaeum sp.]|nr:MAG: hypothetical protein JSW14_04200 [Candidatus Bathyarchaeum sp.]
MLEQTGDLFAMKRGLFVAFSILMLCSLLLLITVGTTMAAEPGYERTSWYTQVMPTIDGVWTSEDEWTDGEITVIGEDVAFRSTWDMGGPDVTTHWIIEFFSDTTNDTGDYWQVCFDGDQSGGTAPQVGDYMCNITGHTDLVWYAGDGTGWTEVALDASEIEWANSLSDSPTNSTSHWILEFQILKNTGSVQLSIYWNFRLAVYDASNPGAGVLAWPPTHPDVPYGWGIENYSSDPIPEGLTFAVMVLLSSVSVLVGSHYLWKRSKKREK